MSASAMAQRTAMPRRWLRLGRLVYLRDVALHLTRLELASRHRGTILGWIWSITPSLLMLGATYFLFTKVIPLDIENYPVFLLVGITAWNWFARSLTQATTSLESRRDLVLRPGFPTGTLPFSAVLVGLVDYLLALPVIFIALAFTTGVRPEAALLPLLMLVQFVFTLGLGVLFAPLQAYARDTRQFVALAVSVGFWITPIFYQARQVPAEFQWILEVNPMSYLIEAERAILLEEVPVPGPAATTLTWVALASVAILALGYALFSRLRSSVPEQL